MKATRETRIFEKQSPNRPSPEDRLTYDAPNMKLGCDAIQGV